MIDPDGGDGRREWGEWLSEFFRSDNTGGVFYGWWLVVIGFLVILLGREIGGAVTLAAYTAWQHEYFDNGLQWYAVVTLGGGAVGLLALPVLGSAIDWAGPRRAVRIGLALVGATVLLAVVPARGLQVIALAATGGLGLVGAYLPVITVLNHWFRRRLVIALAVLLFALTIAGPIVDFGVPLLADLVDWRLVAVAGGLAAVAAMPALSGAIRDRPEYWGERPDGLAADPEGNVPDYSWREALRSRQFWKLVAAFCCASAVESVGHVYAAPVIVDRGVEVDTIREIRQADRYLTMPFILVGGLLGYRWPVRYVLSGAAVLTTAAIGLMFVAHTLEFLIAILLLAATSGIAVAPGIAAVAVYFGRRNFAAITAMTLLFKYLVAFPILPAVGWFGSVWLGGYTVVGMATAVVSLIGAGLYLTLGQPRLSPSQRRLVSLGAGASD